MLSFYDSKCRLNPWIIPTECCMNRMLLKAHQARWMKRPQREDLDLSHVFTCVWPHWMTLNGPELWCRRCQEPAACPSILNVLKTCFMAWLWNLGLDSHVFRTSASILTTVSAPVAGWMCKPLVQSHRTQLLPVPWMLKEVESGRKEIYCSTSSGLTLVEANLAIQLEFSCDKSRK